MKQTKGRPAAIITSMKDLAHSMDTRRAIAASFSATASAILTLRLSKANAKFTQRFSKANAKFTLRFSKLTTSIFTTQMSSCIEATRFALLTIDFDRVGGLIAAADLQRNAVARLTDRLLFRHADLIKSLNQPGSLLASVPPAVSALPTMDVFVHTSAVRSITPHEPLEDEDEERTVPLRCTIANETDMFLEQTLPELKPAFLEQYRGAKARGDGRGPDGWTQGGASMRKLLKGVLHSVAPNEAVLPWATKNNKKLDRHRLPTRATKIEWLCRFSENDVYRAYVQSELKSALAIIDLVDTAQHVDEFPEFAGQYDSIMLRVAFAVRHMLALWKLPR